MKLRHQLFLYTIPVILFFVALNQSVISVYLRNEINRDLKTQLNTIVHFIHHWTETLIGTTLVDLEILGESDSFHDLINYRRYGLVEEERIKNKEIYKMLGKLLHERSAYLAVQVFSLSEKKPLVSIFRNFGKGMFEKVLQFSPVYKDHIEASIPYLDQESGDQILSLKYHLIDRKRKCGYILVYISLRELLNQVNQIKLIYGSSVSIQDKFFNELLAKNVPVRKGIKLISSEPYRLNPFAWEVRLITPEDSLYEMASHINKLLTGLLVLLTLFLSGIFIYLSKRISNPAEKIVEVLKKNTSIKNKSQSIFNAKILESGFEFREIASAIDQMLNQLSAYHEESLRVADSVSRAEVAQQVAHDIRSPLAALNVVSQDISGLGEENRILIRSAINRIHDIANTLMKHSSSRRPTEENLNGYKKNVRRTILLTSLLEIVLTEKRLQYQGDRDVSIEGGISDRSYGLFAKVDEVELKRVISNLIDNSVDARIGYCQIQIFLDLIEKDGNSFVLLGISDNGKGISTEMLNRIGQKGFSFGKRNGAGLGLYHARKSIENDGGHIRIESCVGAGTTIHLFLPRSEAPAWFVPELKLERGQDIVILDDDPSIHQVWERRLNSTSIQDDNCVLHHLFSGESLGSWINSSPERIRHGVVLYLVDYELLNEEKSGLDWIKSLGISKQSILVTSHGELLDEVRMNEIKIIPKEIAAFIPISFSAV